MKLNRIKKVKGYKSFVDFSWQAFMNNEPFNEEVNIIYGENGSGKSSIVNLLKNVSDSKDFDKFTPQEACLVFDNGEMKYPVNNDWDYKIKKGEILFFDREFVDKNIHLGHKRDTTQNGQEQESGKLIIEFDSDAINLREVRDTTKKAKEEQEQKFKEFNGINKASLSFTLSIEDELIYNKLKNKSVDEVKNIKFNLEKEKNVTFKNYENAQELQKKVSEIQNSVNPLSIREITLSISEYKNFQAVFDFNIEEAVKIEAEQTLIDKIKTHKTFFETGFEMRKSHTNQCPFCQSENEEDQIKKILKTYNNIYNATYKIQVQKFEVNKQALINEVSNIIKTLSDFDLNTIFLQLKKLDQNYKIKNIYTVEDENAFKKPITEELKLLLTKVLNLTKPNKENIYDIYSKAKTEFDSIKTYFTTLYDYIEQKNKIINKFKSDNTDEKLQFLISSTTKRIGEIDKELVFINRNMFKEQKEKEQKVKEQKILHETIVELKNKYDLALKNYEEHCSTNAFSKLLSKIQDYFKSFNFSFQLELKTDPSGNKSEFPFAFKVKDLEGNERDFKEGLSEGEMQVLALCFFFAFLDIQKDKKSKILVFDDPITSLDNSNLSHLVDLIAEEQKFFSQTFVLTHHRAFFKFLRKRFEKHCNEYNLIRNKKEFGGSFICISKSGKFIEKLKDFENHLLMIPPASLDIELKIVEYGQYLRYEIERFIKNTLLQWETQNFSVAIDGIKTNKSITDNDLDKIKSIYSFCNWTTSHVAVDEENGLEQLKQKITEFVSIVKK